MATETRSPSTSFALVSGLVRDAVALVAATDPSPEDPFRGLYLTDDAALQTAAELDGETLDDRLGALLERLDLDALDGAVLALCAAPEVDPRYGRLVGYLHDDMSRRRPSARLVARLLQGPATQAATVLARLAADAPLRRGGALQLLAGEDGTPVADRGLAPDRLIVAELLGAELGAVELPAGVRVVTPDSPSPGRAAVQERIRRLAAGDAVAGVGIVCTGPDAEQVLAHALGAPLVIVPGASIADGTVVAHARLRARLAGARLVVGAVDELRDEDRALFATALEALGEEPLVLVGADFDPARTLARRPLRVIGVPGLAPEERAALWRSSLPGWPVDEVASRLPLSGAQIAEASALARAAAAERGDDEPEAGELLEVARQVSRWSLGGLAQRLDGHWTWEDLVLGEDELAAVRSIAAFVRHRDRVLDGWGLGATPGAGAGLTILFSGPSGTGKTMAAQAIANDLGVDGYRIDLSGVVSKWIGETERNLERVFRASEEAGVLLVFDEADALFGKRSAVTDARDRYANLEVAYLLQRIERHPGAVILTTNLRQDIDSAFLRRIDVAVEFPLPTAEHRQELWRRHLPDAAPVAGDVDLERLARAHDLSGGAIRTSVRAAAYAAADDGGTITMAHLEQAVRLELRKLGRLSTGPEERWTAH